MPQGAHFETIEGRRTLIADPGDRFRSGLPDSLERLIAAMTPFGFAFEQDVRLAGTRVACDVLREHRWVVIREGRWHNPRRFELLVGYDRDRNGEVTPRGKVVPAGVLALRIYLCADCGAGRVHDISLEPWTGASASRLLDHRTGQVRVAPARSRRDQVIGWYTGARRNGREYK